MTIDPVDSSKIEAQRELDAATERSLAETLSTISTKIRSYHPDADLSLLKAAYLFAKEAHQKQRRKSGELYIVHPVSVASIISGLKLDVPSICAGFLHDVIEDTTVSLADLEDRFGSEISALVDGVTKLTKLPRASRAATQAENFRKMLIAMAQDIRVIMIKLSDRVDNMRTLEHMSVDRQERIARETIDIYAPLANRLGIFWMKAELEDLSFQYIYPKAYQDLVDSLDLGRDARDNYVDAVIAQLSTMMDENEIVSTVSGRQKNLWSTYRKMRRSNQRVDQLHDIIAFRIVTKTIRDCYSALGVVHENFTPIPGRFKDYIAMPKANQYQSLHTTILGPAGKRVEVQIRTEAMHEVCEYGIAAHWVYKENEGSASSRRGDNQSGSVDDQKKFRWLRQLMEFQRDLSDPAEFIDAVKIDLFDDEVYVFTPDGDVKALPKDATPIDFAFSVHSEVGLRCTGARVNGQIVTLKHRLSNGDTVEILTSASQRPSKDWLNHCASARARSKIRNYIHKEKRQRGRELGKELLEKIFRKNGHSFTKLQKKGRLREVAEVLKAAQGEEELLMMVGIGKITPNNVLRVLFPTQEIKKPTVIDRQVVSKPSGYHRVKTKKTGIEVQGEQDLLVRLAHCCNPLPGDAITGFITRGRGISIHRFDCPRALDIDPERQVDVNWTNQLPTEYPVTINVYSVDTAGILAELSKIFSESGISIKQANCQTYDGGSAINTFYFHVVHVDKLRQVMHAIQRIRGVSRVERL